jgi:type VII secretion protein EccB
MQSALVRRDAVMLHDPMRNHSRATLVGVVLGAVGMVGFLVYGLFSPDPKLDPNDTKIVMSKESGQIYVVRNSPGVQLVPVFNLASARLLLLGESNPDKGQSGQGGGDAAASPATLAGGELKIVSEKVLSTYPKGRLTGIVDAPDMLPGSTDQRIGAEWSVCDQATLDRSQNDPEANTTFKTTVLAGISGGGKKLEGNRSVLVTTDKASKKAFLVYKRPDNSSITSTSTVRAQVDLTDTKIVNALRLQDKTPRPISAGLLNSIRQVGDLKAPDIPGVGEPVGFIGGAQVGDILRAQRTGEKIVYYVVLKDGMQEVPLAVADMIRFSIKGGSTPKDIVLSDVNKVVSTLNLENYPTDIPEVVDLNEDNVVMCLGWRADNVNADNRSEHTEVTLAATLPGDRDLTPVQINQVGATGEAVSQFVMAKGKVGVVRGSTSTEDFATGPIQLITGRGVKYGIPDTLTSGGLGLGKDGFMPAPASIISLLPDGPQLNRNSASRSYDSVPAPNGVLPEDSNKASPGGG